MNKTFVIKIAAQDTTTAVAKKIEAQLLRIPGALNNVNRAAVKLTSGGGFAAIEKSIVGVGKGIAAMAANAARLVPAIGVLTGAASIAGAAAMAGAFGKNSIQLRNLATNLGMSTDELQRYRAAAQFAGLETSEMDGALRGLAGTFEQATVGGNNEALAWMNQFGVAVKRTKDGSVDAADGLRQIARVIGGMTNAQAQARYADMFGVGSLLPLLRNGEAGLASYLKKATEAGVVIGKGGVAAGSAFAEEMVRMDLATKRLVYSMGSALLPTATKVVGAITTLTDRYGGVVATKVAEYSERLATALVSVNWQQIGEKAGVYLDKIGRIASVVGKVVDLVPGSGGQTGGDGVGPPAPSQWQQFKNRFSMRPATTEDMQRTGILASITSKRAYIAELEKKHGLPAGMLAGQWKAESDEGRNASTSSAGAKGDFQFKDATAAQYGVDVTDFRSSASGAARMMADLLAQSGGNVDRALAGYNWGQGNVARQGMGAMPAETRDYISKVRRSMGGQQTVSGLVQPAPAAGDAPKVQLEVTVKGPPGTTASVRASGDVAPGLKVGQTQMTNGTL